MHGNSINITTVENGYIVTVPLRFKTNPRPRYAVDVDSDPMLQDKPDAKPEPLPFQFQVQTNIRVFDSWEKVLAYLATLTDSDRVAGFSGPGHAFIEG